MFQIHQQHRGSWISQVVPFLRASGLLLCVQLPEVFLQLLTTYSDRPSASQLWPVCQEVTELGGCGGILQHFWIFSHQSKSGIVLDALKKKILKKEVLTWSLLSALSKGEWAL